MRKNRVVIISLLAICCLFALDSCRHTRHLANNNIGDSTLAPTPQQGEPSPRNAIQLDTIRNLHYNNFSANFSCTVEGMNVNGQIRILHDSIIWISCAKIFEVARLRFTPTRVQGYSRLMNKYYDGDYESLAKRWGIDLDYNTLQSLITGSCPAHCVKSEEPKAIGDSVTLLCTQKVNNYSRTVKLVKRLHDKKMTTAIITTDAVKQTLACRYSAHQSIGDEKAPGLISIDLKCRRGNYSTRLKIDKIALDTKQDYPFSIPERANKI